MSSIGCASPEHGFPSIYFDPQVESVTSCLVDAAVALGYHTVKGLWWNFLPYCNPKNECGDFPFADMI